MRSSRLRFRSFVRKKAREDVHDGPGLPASTGSWGTRLRLHRFRTRAAARALAPWRWPLLLLWRPRLYLRGALLGAFFSVFATVTLASGGIIASPAVAPEAPEAIVAEDPPPPPTVPPSAAPPPLASPAQITPSEDFIRETLRTSRGNLPPGALREDTIEAYALLAGWPSELLDDLLDVAWCESRYNPLAVNGYMRGLMQVNTIWFDYSATDRDRWTDPLVNLRVAYAVYEYDLARGNEPWAQWQCKPGGSVLAAGSPGTEHVSILEPAATPGDGGDTAPAAPGATPSPETQPEPTPTPAPWDQKPSWPPKYDRPQVATPTPEPATPTTATP